MAQDAQHIRHVTTGSFAAEVMEASRHTPVLVDFWADWCEPCKQLMPVLEKLAAEYDGRFILAKVNCDQEQMLAAQVGVRSLPTVILVKDGQVAGQFQGVQPEGSIRELLDAHVAAPTVSPAQRARAFIDAGDIDSALPLLEEARVKDPKDMEIGIELAGAYLHRGDADAARAVLDELPSESADDSRVRAMQARFTFAERAADLPAMEALQQRLQQDDNPEARHQLALHLVSRGEYARAMDELLALMRSNAGWQDGQGRKTMLEVFDLLGPEQPLVREYRQKLFRMMY